MAEDERPRYNKNTDQHPSLNYPKVLDGITQRAYEYDCKRDMPKSQPVCSIGDEGVFTECVGEAFGDQVEPIN